MGGKEGRALQPMCPCLCLEQSRDVAQRLGNSSGAGPWSPLPPASHAGDLRDFLLGQDFYLVPAVGFTLLHGDSDKNSPKQCSAETQGTATGTLFIFVSDLM